MLNTKQANMLKINILACFNFLYLCTYKLLPSAQHHGIHAISRLGLCYHRVASGG